MRHSKLILAAVPVMLGFAATQAHAQLTIVPTYDATILNDPNAAAIEASIQADCNYYNTTFTNPTVVNILFQEGGGLGTSSTFINTVSYADYVAALRTNEQGQGFLNFVPDTNPVNGSSEVTTSLANLRTLGFSGDDISPYDSTITLNTAICNLSRTGPQDPDKYDLQGVAFHEIDEVLGIGSALNGSTNGAPAPTGPIGSLDLFRYDGDGSRSFTTDENDPAYLSADGGAHALVYFNQTQGGDFHDWYSTDTHSGAIRAPYQVQDAFSTPGMIANLGTPELTALQMVGYNLAAAPEPSQYAGLGLGALGLIGLVFKARRRKAGVSANA